MPQSTRARFGPSVPRPATAERAQISRWHVKSSDRSSCPTRSAAHSSAASPSANLLGRLDSDHKSLPRLSNLHNACGTALRSPKRGFLLGGFRTPAAELVVPSLMRPASETLHTSGRSHSKSGTAAYLLIFPPHLDGTNGKVSVQTRLADARSVPARARRQYHRPAEMRGHCRHERPELDTGVQTLGRLALPSHICRCSVCSAE
jgi:hypothetical protein